MRTSGSLAESAKQNRREWPRYTAERNFVLAANIDGRVVPCTVADISLGGAKLIFDTEVPSDAPIELSHPEIDPVNCAQIWHSSHEIGVGFDFSEVSLDLISVCIRNMIDLEHQPQVTA